MIEQEKTNKIEKQVFENNQEFAVSSIKLMKDMWREGKKDFVRNTGDILLSFLSKHDPYKQDKVKIIKNNNETIEIVTRSWQKAFMLDLIPGEKEIIKKEEVSNDFFLRIKEINGM